jgi:hypothetical protein
MYNQYVNFVKDVCDSNDISSFKYNSIYRVILEHLSPELGLQFLNCINNKTNISMDVVKEFCELNDKVGTPILAPYSFGLASPSSLRYIYQSHLILSNISTLYTDVNIIELGGGYGGLCLALKFFASDYNVKINSYTIIDLYEITRLQRMYHNEHGVKDVTYVDAMTYGSRIPALPNSFLVSNYCYSELSLEDRQTYDIHLLPKINAGFMAWNNRASGAEVLKNFNVVENPEVPNTNHMFMNKYVYFN